MKRILLILAIIIPINNINAQSLGKERVDRLKHSVVQILIGGHPSGTGFFISEDLILTCYHVVSSASTTNKISIRFADGETIGVPGIATENLKQMTQTVAYDFCLIGINHKPKQKVIPLKITSFKDIDEGDAVYTCGYPQGIPQQFISSGILSTKYIDKFNKARIPQSKTDTIVPRQSAWLDLTMNRGNSGGPIIKLGKTAEEDRVVGIATFILNPFAQKAEDILMRSADYGKGLQIMGIDQSESVQLFSLAIANSSMGISGCISIDYFLNMYGR